jgi:hypothetical protein
MTAAVCLTLLAGAALGAQIRTPATAREFAETAAEFAHSLGAHAAFGGPMHFSDYSLEGSPPRRVDCPPKEGWWVAALSSAPGPFWRPVSRSGVAYLSVTVYYDQPTPDCVFGIFDEQIELRIANGKVHTTRPGFGGSVFEGARVGGEVKGTLIVPAGQEPGRGRDAFRMALTLTTG